MNELLKRKEHYQNQLQDIQNRVREYYLCEMRPPKKLVATEKYAAKLVRDIEKRIQEHAE